MRRSLTALAVLAATSACATAGRVPDPPDPAVCAGLFARYDTDARVYGTGTIDGNYALVPPAPLSRWIGALRTNGCLTFSDDLAGMATLHQRLNPFVITDSGPAIRPTPVHLGIVTSISDEAWVTQVFRGLGYRSRGIGASGLGRRLYIGPFTTQGALDQALTVAREAGFIAPYAATHTRF